MMAVAEQKLMKVERRGRATDGLTQIADALNQITRFTYDPENGNLLSTIDPFNHATNIAYNQFGQPISVTDALNHMTTLEYNDIGDLIATVDLLENRTLRGKKKGATFLAICGVARAGAA